MKYNIDKAFECCYGHRVWNQSLNAKYSLFSLCKCRHLHGHQMTMKVGLGSDDLNLGMVTDFNHLNCIKQLVDDVIDHHFIMDINDPLFYNIFPELGGSADRFIVDHGYYKLVDTEAMKKEIEIPNEAVYEKLEGLVIVDFVPTSENLCRFFYNIANETLKELLEPQGIKVTYIDFWETPKSHCRYSPETEWFK